MKNLTIETRKDGKLALVFDPKMECGVSSTGKSITVASSGGNVTIGVDTDGNEIKVGFNAFKANKGTRLPVEAKKAPKAKAPRHPVPVTPAAGDLAALIRAEIAKALTG